MGSKRKVARWYRDRKQKIYVVMPPDWNPDRDGWITFTSQEQMTDFALAAGLMLREERRSNG